MAGRLDYVRLSYAPLVLDFWTCPIRLSTLIYSSFGCDDCMVAPMALAIYYSVVLSRIRKVLGIMLQGA